LGFVFCNIIKRCVVIVMITEKEGGGEGQGEGAK